MKKSILKIFGVAALAAGMLYNVQVFDSERSLDISLAALGSLAVAQSEGGDRGCILDNTGCCIYPDGMEFDGHWFN